MSEVLTMKVDHLLFDYNGTLAESKPLAIAIFNELAGIYGFNPMKPEDIDYLSTLSIMERAKLLKVPIYKFPKLRSEYKLIYKRLLPSLRVAPGVDEMLREAKLQGYKLIIVSSHNAENIHYFLKNNNIDFFDSVHSASDWFGKHQTINSFARSSGVNKNQMLYFGDEIRDVKACQKAGVKMVAVGWGYDALSRMKEEKVDFLIGKPSEVMDILKRLS